MMNNVGIDVSVVDFDVDNSVFDVVAVHVAHTCTRFPCYLGMEINQCKDPMDNNKDCQVGQLTTVDADIVNGDIDVFTSLIKFKYL